MKLKFYGAAHEVTGSCFHLQVGDKNIFIDCGLKQGTDYSETETLPIAANAVDFVILTHAHIDHSGNIPRLYNEGFRGEVHTTDATTSLCDIMLRDSAHIQEFEAEWKNRKNKRAGREQYYPAYTMEDAEKCMELFSEHEYGEKFTLCDGVQVRFNDAGHLLGSAIVEIWVEENNLSKKLVFSGDLGNKNQPLINDPVQIKKADYIICESTYADRLHEDGEDYSERLAVVIERTLSRGGNLVIPSFAVGRTQEILYFIRKIKEKNLVSIKDFPVYVDSPLAAEATEIYQKRFIKYFDKEAVDLVSQGINPISFKDLKIVESVEESKYINSEETPKVIISASGMCDAGRIKHHLKHNLWREESTILFVGFQAQGTLGRKILDGALKVRLFGEEVEVRAEIISLQGVSAHADKNGLLNFINGFDEKPEKVFVVHGQREIVDGFEQLLKTEYSLDVFAPYIGAEFDLSDNRVLSQGKKEIKIKKRGNDMGNFIRPNSPFGRLLIAYKRLEKVIKNNAGGANKDIAKFADQIIALCDKWDR
ncbi:MAG: MBL fold metallo-hydrolase [Clostridia bacterium]|nr:MBL fold metallo-hydrolase [Clostridia bacterium]